MAAIVNSAIPPAAMAALSSYCEVIPFHTEGIVPDPLSGHADLFISTLGGRITAAPNLPQHYRNILEEKHPHSQYGTIEVSESIASLGAYNIAGNEDLAIANPDYAEPSIIPAAARLIPVRQGMCRCAALVLDQDHVATSDGGIHKAILAAGISSLLVDPHPIQLPGYSCGCFGGCCGISGNTLFLLGNLNHHPQGSELRQFILSSSISEIIELADAPLFDAGSILFI